MSTTANKRRLLAVRVQEGTRERVDAIAAELGCRRINPSSSQVVGSTGRLLDMIASGELVVTPSAPKELRLPPDFPNLSIRK